MTSSEPPSFDELRAAEATFRVWRDGEAIRGIVTAAVALLVAGSDTPNLRILAGEDRAEPHELEHWLDATLRDLRLEPLDPTTSVLLVARQLALRAIGDERAAREVAPIIWRLFVREPMRADWPRSFVRLAGAADGLVDLPWLNASLPNFDDAAREFVHDEAHAGWHRTES